MDWVLHPLCHIMYECFASLLPNCAYVKPSEVDRPIQGQHLSHPEPELFDPGIFVSGESGCESKPLAVSPVEQS